MDEKSEEDWLSAIERNASGKSGTAAKKKAKKANNYEAAHKIPRRGLPVMVTDDPEFAMKYKDGHCCLLCGSEVAPIVVPIYAKQGNFFTVVCGSCKGRRYWFRFASSIALNEMSRRESSMRIKRRREQWNNVLKQDENQ